MWLNPEIQKNIWTDFSRQRLFLPPAVIALFAYLSHAYIGDEATGMLCYALACFYIFIMGTKNAAAAVIEEVNDATWDFQRQSSISPIRMAWGKLLGSTLFSWYVAVCAFAAYIVFAQHEPMADRWQTIGILILGGLSSQAMALLLSLQGLPTVRQEKSHKSFRYVIGGLLLGWTLTVTTVNVVKYGSGTTVWYGFDFQTVPFLLTVLVLLIAWIFIGLFRSFKHELQYAQLPWIWLAFNLFCIILFPGFFSYDIGPFLNALPDASTIPSLAVISEFTEHLPYYMTFGIASILTYVAILTDKIDVLRYYKGFQRFKSRQSWRHILVLLPWWITSFVLTCLCLVGISLFIPTMPAIPESASQIAGMWAATGLLIRDILIAHYFYFAPNPKNAITTIIIYYLLLYWLVPGVLALLGMKAILPALLAYSINHSIFTMLAILAQIAFMGVLCYRRWNRTWKNSLCD